MLVALKFIGALALMALCVWLIWHAVRGRG